MAPQLDVPAALEELLERVPALVRKALPAGWVELDDVVRHAMPSPMPRLIALPLACAHAGRGDVSRAMHAAAAWATLNLSLRVLDDLQDQDREDGLWRTVGPSQAYHFAATLREVASCILATAAEIDETTRLAAVADMTRALLLVGRGQSVDLQGGRRDIQDQWTVMQDKSGELFALACRLGCRLAGVPEASMVALSQYGFHLGIALQLLDDLASVLPAEQHRDLQFGRMGFPLHMALTLRDSPAELTQLISLPLPWDVHRIAELIRATGAHELTLWTARQEQQRALHQLDGLEPQGRRLLEQLCAAPFPAGDMQPPSSSPDAG
jgi:geranylgeranyl diphosphate synthase, type I